MTKPFVRFAVAATSALSLLALAGCANNSTPSASAAAGAGPTLVNAGKLTVCTHLAYKPFQFKDSTNTIVGFDVDLMDVVAKKLNVTQEILDIEFGQITSGSVFTARKCDVGAAAITITDERAAASLFSKPYFKATQALLTKSDSGITKLEDLKGKVLAVQTDTTGKDYAEENEDTYGYTVKVFDDMPSASNAVLSGAAAATMNDNGVMFGFAKDNPTTKVVTEFQTGESYGFNTGKDNTAMLAAMDGALDEARADGTFNTIYKKWFGVDAPTD